MPRPRGGVAVAAAAAVVSVAAVIAVIGPSSAPPPGDSAPPARVLSRYETAGPRNAIIRDCGFSVPDPAAAGRSLWLFCDSVWKGTTPGMWLGSTAAAGTYTPGRVPTRLTEIPQPPIQAVRPEGPPQPLLGTPPGLTIPGSGTPCTVSGVAYSASWVAGAARIPGTADLLLTYTDVCVNGQTITPEGFGIARYRPATNTLTQQKRLFFIPGGLPFQLNLGSPVFWRGHLYLYAYRCDVPVAGTCQGGRVTLARVPADPGAWQNPSAYTYRGPFGWTPDASQAQPVVPGAAPTGVHVEDFAAAGKGLVLIEQPDIAGSYRIWQASTPEGPWRVTRTGRMPCAGGSGVDLCRAYIGHPELSTRDDLLMSYYNPAEHHLSVRAVPW
ncbi:hypothetical protein J4573_47135 [Actinomadura barringtoniae]|uniref:DUF4185 domain-containing protein n=1 Tax=Actinomadura barringtoniae TaxID=1427535 RepID=A0A939TFU0_9ACTN|nr:hypothetical protein [Actinomadura barringtoniae]MBO2454735.1 hypothetical protein [Actinomadura barringtoniae]